MKDRPKKMKPGRKLDDRRPGGRNIGPPAGSVTPISPRRRRIFRFVALIISPLLALGGLELVLRVAGCGYNTGFFEEIQVAGRDYLVNNENFSLRFFPPQLARFPSPVMFEKSKPANTCRIFILGESAARGEPVPAAAASRYLGVLLEQRFPGTHFEVVNLGITAIDSHVILPMARDCARADGDLWIVYMGNNEMVGPFGAATVFGAKAPPLGLVRMSLALEKTRVGQTLAKVGAGLKGGGSRATWGGMKMFMGNQLSPDDLRREVGYQNFERNLRDIIAAGLNSGAKILLSTVAVNLKDCPPFASLHNSQWPSSDLARFDGHYQEACAQEARNHWNEAAAEFSQADEAAPQFAELEYRWGRCLLATGRLVEARQHLQNACDDDALPFRADSRINGIIKTTARKYPGEQLTFFDAQAALGNELPGTVCGHETFFEHVHFNFAGNYRLGRAWAEEVAKMLPREISRGAQTNGWATESACDDLLGLTDWDRHTITEIMIDRFRRPPLSGQSNNAEEIELLQNEDKQLRERMNPTTARQAVETYQKAIYQAPRDPFPRENFAEFLEAAGNLREAAGQWQSVEEILPRSCDPYYQAGRLLSLLNQWGEAKAALNTAIILRPRLAEAWFERGGVFLGTKKFADALRNFNQARQLEPENATYCAYAGKALSKLGRPAEAVGLYRQAIQMQPDLWEAHFALADELAAASQFAPAADEYEQVIQLRPGLSIARLDHGVMLARLDRFDEALLEFQEVLRRDPDNQQAREYFGRVQSWKNSGRQ